MTLAGSSGDYFISNYLHPLFYSKNDEEMLSQMVWIFFLCTLSVVVIMLIFPAPYGNFINEVQWWAKSNTFCFMLISWHFFKYRKVQQCKIWISCSSQICLGDTGIASFPCSTFAAPVNLCNLLEFSNKQNTFDCSIYTLHSKVCIFLQDWDD